MISYAKPAGPPFSSLMKAVKGPRRAGACEAYCNRLAATTQAAAHAQADLRTERGEPEPRRGAGAGIYGTETLEDIRRRTEIRAQNLGLVVDFRQSNSEGELINWIQEAREQADGIVLNAGAYTHTSVGILDALNAAGRPVIELHLSNVFRREPFRHTSYVTPAAQGLICGFGPKGYELAIEAMADLLAKTASGAGAKR